MITMIIIWMTPWFWTNLRSHSTYILRDIVARKALRLNYKWYIVASQESPLGRRMMHWWKLMKMIFMPPPLGAGGIMFSGCPSVRPSDAWNTLFWPVHGSVGPPDQPWPFYGMSVPPSVRPSVRPSWEVSGDLPENAWKKWPEILHADVSWPSPELVSLWPQSVDFCNFRTILT